MLRFAQHDIKNSFQTLSNEKRHEGLMNFPQKPSGRYFGEIQFQPGRRILNERKFGLREAGGVGESSGKYPDIGCVHIPNQKPLRLFSLKCSTVVGNSVR